jgi:hypothetical protein
LLERRRGCCQAASRLLDHTGACGTTVNDTHIGGDRMGGRLELGNGDVIRLGTVTSPFIFRFVTERKP